MKLGKLEKRILRFLIRKENRGEEVFASDVPYSLYNEDIETEPSDLGKSEPRSIYVSCMRAIQQLEQKGLITSRPYHSWGRVNKKIKLKAKVGKLRNRLKKKKLS